MCDYMEVGAEAWLSERRHVAPHRADMRPYLEREVKLLARSWETLASTFLIAAAFGFVFDRHYAAGLVAVNFVAALYGYVQVLREEELGTLDGLRLLRQPEKVAAAKFFALFLTSVAASFFYSAIYYAASMRPPELWLLPPTSAYFAAASTASALLSTAAKSGVTVSMTLTAALVLGYSLSLAAGRMDLATLAMPLTALLTLLALSRSIVQ
jgi:hypothetical protein